MVVSFYSWGDERRLAMKNIIKKILVFWLVIYLVIISPVTQANLISASGWAMTAFNLPTNTLTAVKNGLSVSVKAMPSASTVGSFAIRAAGSVAIAYAVAKYGGQSIDWVLDPANNSVRSKPGSNIAGGGTTMFCKWYDECTAGIYNYSTAAAAGEATCAGYSETFVSIRESPPYTDGQYLVVVCKRKDGSEDLWSTRVKIVSGDKVVSADEIGNDILNKAKAGDSAMANVVSDAMADRVGAGAYDLALDKAAADNVAHNCDTGTSWNGSACVADPAKPADPTKLLDLSSVLSALQSIFTAIKDLANQIVEPIKTVINSVWNWFKEKYDAINKQLTEFFDWAYSKDYARSLDKEKPVDVPQADITLKDPSEFDKDYISVSAQCPADVERDIPVGNQSFKLVYQMSPICDFLTTYMRPVIIFLAYIAAGLSIGNAFKVGG